MSELRSGAVSGNVIPRHPDLDQLKKQARELLRAAHSGDAASMHRLAANTPRLTKTRDATDLRPRLADAQFVIAKENGFPSWARLKAYIESLAGPAGDRLRPTTTDIDYLADRAEGLRSAHKAGLPLAASQIAAQHPEFRNRSSSDILAAPFSQDDARLVTAREHGFEDWDRLRRYLRRLKAGQATEPFLEAFRAIQSEDIDRLSNLLRRDPSLILARGTNGNTLLNLAVGCRSLLAAQCLVDVGADVNAANVRGSTPLHQAAYSNLSEVAELLLRAGARWDVEAHGEGGTPLAFALFWGNQATAQILASYGVAPVNLRTAAGIGRIDLMSQMFDGGRLKPEAGIGRGFYRPHSGFPVWKPSGEPQEILDEAFVTAAKNGRIEALALLLDRGANPNSDPYRGPALHWVATRHGSQTPTPGNVNVEASPPAPLRNGEGSEESSPSTRSRSGEGGGDSALAAAPRNGEGSIGSSGTAGAVETAGWLIDHGADVNLKATFGGPGHGLGITPLHLAAQNGNLEMVRYLIGRGADPGIREDLYQGTPLSHAEHFGHPEVAEFLRGLKIV